MVSRRNLLLKAHVMRTFVTLAVVLLGVQAASAIDPDAVEKRKPKELTVDLGGGVKMELVLIPTGEFLMGSHESAEETAKKSGMEGAKADWFKDEHPLHKVQITKPFYLGKYEVTQQEYQRVMGENPSWFSSTGGGKDAVKGKDTSRFPVETVSWDDAVEFCRKLSALPAEKAAGRSYRLPTEAEWEYACRAGTTTPFHFGSSLNGKEANCDGNYPYGTETKGPSLGRTTARGSYQPNDFGLYDMHGNVWEWCQDRYAEDYCGKSPVKDPQGPTAAGAPRVLRGGGWYLYPSFCRSASRFRLSPVPRSLVGGFRVLRVR